MAGTTDELEDELFASLLHKPKGRGRPSTKSPPTNKLFDHGINNDSNDDDDDILSLLADEIKPQKKNEDKLTDHPPSITSPGINPFITGSDILPPSITSSPPPPLPPSVTGTPDKRQSIQFGSYTPTIDRPIGPIDFGVIDQNIPRKITKSSLPSKSVHFNISTDDDSTSVTKDRSHDSHMTPTSTTSASITSVTTDRSHDSHMIPATPGPPPVAPLINRIDDNQITNNDSLMASLKDELDVRDNLLIDKIHSISTGLQTKMDELTSLMKTFHHHESSVDRERDDNVITRDVISDMLRSLHEEMKSSICTVVQDELLKERQSTIQANQQLSEDVKKCFEIHNKNCIERYDKLSNECINLHQMKVNASDELLKLETERQKIIELMTKLEDHIYQKDKEIEQRMWEMTQREGKLTAQQTAFNEERQRSLMKIEEQRSQVQKMKEQLLREQQEIIRNSSVKELVDGSSKEQINDKLQLLKRQLEEEREGWNEVLKEKTKEFDEERMKLKLERERLQQLETELSIRAIEIKESSEIAHSMYCQGEAALQKANALEENLKQQFHMLQREKALIKEHERKLAAEKTLLMERKRNIMNDHIGLAMNRSTNIKELELTDGLHKIMERIEKDDDSLAEEKVFLEVVKSPSSITSN